MTIHGFLRYSGVWLLASSAAIQAQLVSVGPFTGSLSEGWESLPPPPEFSGSVPVPHMGGAAILSAPGLALGGRTENTDSIGTSGMAKPVEGLQYAYIQAGPNILTFTFQTPVQSFGGYWGTFTGVGHDDPAQLHFAFFDANGSSVGTEDVAYSHADTHDGLLDWHGWQSSAGIKSIEITSPLQVMSDGLQAQVPEPVTTGIVAGFGLFVFGVWRRVRS